LNFDYNPVIIGSEGEKEKFIFLFRPSEPISSSAYNNFTSDFIKIMSKSLFLLGLLISLILAIYIQQLFSANNNLVSDNLEDQESPVKSAEEREVNVVAPIKDFEKRITKKPFGIFITPATSPVQPERFSGYHTGLDVEYGDVEEEVAVLAMADGLVEHAGWVAGYGGTVAIRHLVNDKKYLAIYAHLNPARLVAKGKKVTKSEQIGVLGRGNTPETDGERKHLHFALYTGSDLNLQGYVESQEQLLSWIDPRIIFPSF